MVLGVILDIFGIGMRDLTSLCEIMCRAGLHLQDMYETKYEWFFMLHQRLSLNMFS